LFAIILEFDGRTKTGKVETKRDRGCQRLDKQNSGGVFTVGKRQAAVENVCEVNSDPQQ